MSTVTIADNVQHNITQDEQTKVMAFRGNPGYGGQTQTVKIGYDKIEVSQVSFGRAYGHVAIFYKRDGENYVIQGIGYMDGKREGKTIYQALWADRGGSRVTVKVVR